MNVSSVSLVTSALALATGLAGLSAARRRHEELSRTLAVDAKTLACEVREHLAEDARAEARARDVAVAQAAVDAARARLLVVLGGSNPHPADLDSANFALACAETSLRLLA